MPTMDFLARNSKFISKSSNNAIAIGSLILDLPPSCLEFLPVSNITPWVAEESCFVVGTYDLQKEEQDGEEKEEEATSVPKEQSRQGSLTLFRLKNGELETLSTIATPSAILDLHFYKNTSLFAVASSTGTISIYHLKSTTVNDQREHSLVHVKSLQILAKDEIITSFAWLSTSETVSDEEKPVMAITSTSGAVMILRFNGGLSFTDWEFLNDGEVVSQHSFEAWCCAFSEKGETLFSGGDDSKLIMSSLNTPEPSSRKLPFHNAGVTAILPVPTSSSSQDTTTLLTGSYDDFIRVYLLPSPTNSKPKVLAEKDIGLGGGGVWRLKFLEQPSSLVASESGEDVYVVLATCMRVGCKILKITKSKSDEWAIEVLAHTGVHESMNYASDVVPLPFGGDKSKERTIVSTSFYDRLLFVWKYDREAQAVEGGN